MIRFTALAAALISASLATPAQAGWSNGLGTANGISLNGLNLNGLKDRNGISLHGAAAATATLLQGITLPNGITIAR